FQHNERHAQRLECREQLFDTCLIPRDLEVTLLRQHHDIQRCLRNIYRQIHPSYAHSLYPSLQHTGFKPRQLFGLMGEKRRDDLDSVAGLIPRARPIYRARNNYLIHTRPGRDFLVEILRLSGFTAFTRHGTSRHAPARPVSRRAGSDAGNDQGALEAPGGAAGSPGYASVGNGGEMGNRTGRKKPRQGRGFFSRGGQGQNRTADTRIFSPLLYQLSYLAKNWLFSLPDAVRTFSPCLPCRYAAPLPGLVYGPAPRTGRERRLLKRPGGATSSAGWGLLRRDW